jgi:HEAT repeat protein
MIRNLLTGIFGYFFDAGEFIVGILLGILFSWIFIKIRPAREELSSWIQMRLSIRGERMGRVSLDRYRSDLIERASALHIAKALFALDEIIVEPRLLAPPTTADQGRTESAPEDTLSVLPNLPDWKYLSGLYRSPTISLAEALAGGANLLITGAPGSGKTTALAYLAIRVALRDDRAGVASSLTPVFIHAADIVLDRATQKDPLSALIAAVQSTVSPAAASRLPGHLKSQFNRGNGLLLLDGLDEFPSNELPSIASWLQELLDKYPKNRIVAAGAVKYYDGLLKVGLIPAYIAPWSDHEHRVFLDRWCEAWQENIAPLLPKKRLAEVDPALLTGWLTGLARGFTPLEMTMFVWASYVGDVRGAKISQAYESYVSRFLSPNERKSAQETALAWIQSRSGIFDDRIVRRGTPINEMADAGLVSRHAANRYTFSNPAIGAFLAASDMTENGIIEEATHLGWEPAEATMAFFSAMGDISGVAERYLNVKDDPLERHLLAAAAWLRESSAKSEWRAATLRRLATIANSHDNPYGLRLRAIHALSYSRESSVGILYQRLLASNYPSSRVLGALGLGGLGDEETVGTLRQTINDRHNLHTRQAACLALGAIGTEDALEGLGRLLLEGEEDIRIAAAEALACNPSEGYAMLREAVEMKDLLTRRAAVFGLARIPDDWSLEILETLQVEDDQWIVRGAAAEAVERRKNSPWTIRPRLAEVSEEDWLIGFAEKEGLGVAPGKAATEMIRRALNKGTPDEQISALEAIAWTGDEDLHPEVFKALRSSETHLRDAAFEALWQMSAAGFEIRKTSPVPTPT